MTLDAIPAGSRVFIDASIFIYHFAGASAECRGLLERCERLDVKGVTSVVAVAETAHRLMLLEALSRGLVSGANLVRKLREKPDVVRQLHLYREQVERIPLMGVSVVALDLKSLLRSADVRDRHGLLVNDSLIVTTARDLGVKAVASADEDFGRVPELQIYRPGDLAA